MKLVIEQLEDLTESFSGSFLYHTVFSEKSYNYVLQNGIIADEYGYVYLSEKPLKGYYTFKVKIPNINNLYDWEDFWLDDEGNEIDFDHQYDPNNKYYMYLGDIPISYIK